MHINDLSKYESVELSALNTTGSSDKVVLYRKSGITKIKLIAYINNNTTVSEIITGRYGIPLCNLSTAQMKKYFPDINVETVVGNAIAFDSYYVIGTQQSVSLPITVVPTSNGGVISLASGSVSNRTLGGKRMHDSASISPRVEIECIAF